MVDHKDKAESPAMKRAVAWCKTLGPLVLHGFFSIGTIAFMTYYVNDRHFNLTDRRTRVPLPDGESIVLSKYVPLQSDITALVSLASGFSSALAAVWAAWLGWGGALFLMEKTGLRHTELDLIISWGLFIPIHDRHRLRILPIWFTSLAILATLAVRPSSPILTSSITWIPSNRLIAHGSDVLVNVSVVANADEWNMYSNLGPLQQWAVQKAADFVNIAWLREGERGIHKRVLPATARLNINSTLTNVTLPYFAITSLQWISDPVNTLPPDQLNLVRDGGMLNVSGAANPLQPGVAVFIQDPRNATLFPLPSAISETRTLVLNTHQLPEGETCQSHNSEMFGSLPPAMGLMQQDLACYAFARVTYSAGASVCTDCRVSSYLTVQNDTALSRQQDPMTTEALRLMADVTVLLVQENSSIPFAWDDVDDYVVATMSRSYSGAWTALTSYLGQSSAPLTSSFSISVSSLRAQVDLRRVYVWLAIQLLVTVSGVAFLFVRADSEHDLNGDINLLPLRLHTVAVTSHEGEQPRDYKKLMWLEKDHQSNRLCVRFKDPNNGEK